MSEPCMEWEGSRRPDGYGRVGNKLAHRLVYMELNGPIPPEVKVRHTCDNPPCYEPTHLIAGTQAENMADMLARGRHARAGRREPGAPRDARGRYERRGRRRGSAA